MKLSDAQKTALVSLHALDADDPEAGGWFATTRVAHSISTISALEDRGLVETIAQRSERRRSGASLDSLVALTATGRTLAVEIAASAITSTRPVISLATVAAIVFGVSMLGLFSGVRELLREARAERRRARLRRATGFTERELETLRSAAAALDRHGHDLRRTRSKTALDLSEFDDDELRVVLDAFAIREERSEPRR